jgi:hypothetical protein
MKREEFTLEIDIFTPSTIPMSRLAEYLQQFSELLGHEANVHFSKLGKGSLLCKAYAEEQVAPKVRERVASVVDGTAPKPALKAHSMIDDLLAADNGIGGIYSGEEKIIEFPGRRRAIKERIGPVQRSTTLDGQIYSIGGRDDTINVHLRRKDKTVKCEVSIELARRLAPFFLAGNIRLFGRGDWYRVDSVWEMTAFTAVDFIELDGCTLGESIGQIRDVFAGVSGDGLLSEMNELRQS